MRSAGVLPLLNRPVAFPPMKSRPYGGKLLFATVLRLLLLPVSTMESPNMKTAGTVTLSGSTTLPRDWLTWVITMRITCRGIMADENERTRWCIMWVRSPISFHASFGGSRRRGMRSSFIPPLRLPVELLVDVLFCSVKQIGLPASCLMCLQRPIGERLSARHLLISSVCSTKSISNLKPTK